MADIFGTVGDKVRELWLADAKDPEDFFSKLMSLEKKWNGLEIQHRHFLTGQNRQPCFYEWFCVYYSSIFSESVVQSIRQSAGLGSLYRYVNRNSQINEQTTENVKISFYQKLKEKSNLCTSRLLAENSLKYDSKELK